MHWTPYIGHLTCDMLHLTHDTWRGTPDMWHMVSSPVLTAGTDSVLKILNKIMTELINDEGVHRTAAATPGMLITN